MSDKLVKTDEEWREQLDADQYSVCRRAATEAPFSGRYDQCKEAGVYRCACCGNDLFESGEKFDSGSGWPSFSAPAGEGRVQTRTDRGHGMTRTEVLCDRCDAHLGHVFPDGPAPTHQRYCINSVALAFAPEGSDE